MSKLFFTAANNDGIYRYYSYDIFTEELVEYDLTVPILIDTLTNVVKFTGDVEFFNNSLFFTSDNINSGFELWSLTNNDLILYDINPNENSSNVKDLISINNHLYFYADNGTQGRELWHIDVNNQATIAKDIWEGSKSSFIKNQNEWINFEEFNNGLILSADNGEVGQELWFYDLDQLRLVKDIRENTSFLSINNGSQPQEIKGDQSSILNNQLFFSANNGINGRELWVTDSKDSGTWMVKDIYVGPESSNPTDFQVFGDYMYFTAVDGIHGRELWMTNGIETSLIDISQGKRSSNPKELTVFNDTLYFTATHPDYGPELFKIDTPGGNYELLKDIRPGKAGVIPSNLTVVNNEYMVFSGITDDNKGRELWVTDGSAENTELLKDIWVGDKSSSPKDFLSYNGNVYFNAEDENGRELWVTNGMDSGTRKLFDIGDNLTGSYPIPLIGYETSDIYTGTNNNDIFQGNSLKKEEFLGLDGFDIVSYNETKEFFDFYNNDVFDSIEKVELTNGNYRFDFKNIKSADDIYQMYFAAFGRIPDINGFEFWVNYDLSKANLAEIFSNSNEFKTMFNDISFNDFLVEYYINILDKNPRTEEFKIFFEQYENTNIKDFLIDISDSEYINSITDEYKNEDYFFFL